MQNPTDTKKRKTFVENMRVRAYTMLEKTLQSKWSGEVVFCEFGALLET